MAFVRRVIPFGDLVSLRQAMDRLFEESFVNSDNGDGQLVPIDVVARDAEIVVEAILPGVKPEEVDISVEGNVLTIAGDTTSATAATATRDGSVLLREIRRGRFSRTLTLPDGIEPEKATATFEDGVLTLRIPKAEQVRPRQIKITTEQARSTGDGQHAQPAGVETK